MKLRECPAVASWRGMIDRFPRDKQWFRDKFPAALVPVDGQRREQVEFPISVPVNELNSKSRQRNASPGTWNVLGMHFKQRSGASSHVSVQKNIFTSAHNQVEQRVAVVIDGAGCS